MVESEDEFAELCSKLLKRVKKSKPVDGHSVSNASTTAARSKLKRSKQPVGKNKASNGAGKEAEHSNKTGGNAEDAAERTPSSSGSKEDLEKLSGKNGAERIGAVPTPSSNESKEDLEKLRGKNGAERTDTVPTPSSSESKEDLEKISVKNGAERTCAVLTPSYCGSRDDLEKLSGDVTTVQNDDNQKESQEEPSSLSDQGSVKDRVLERMQQFKRTAPVRMKLNSEVLEEPIETFKLQSEVNADGDLAMALQMDLKEQQPVSLEDEGLFFCQLCQKDLTGMSSVLREQHVNRCLDQGEGGQSNPVVPVVPSCPLCGKNFATEKSRSAHLKRCAAKLEVPAQTLLQAVQRQATEAGTEVPTRIAKVKRKGVPKQKGPSKKRKVAQTGAEMEDLMVAMALSRSMQEEDTKPNRREIAPPEKKSRRKKKDKPTPLLLVQAPEEAVQKLQKRMSMLLSEEPVHNNLLELPASHFWNIQMKERETWSLRAGKKCVLWDISNLIETRDTISYYTPELNPPITPWKPTVMIVPGSQSHTAAASVTPNLSVIVTASQTHKENTVTLCKAQTPPSDSQKDRQALLDLADLAGEGMTLTQWNCLPSNTNNQTGRESPVAIACSGFIPSDEDATRRQSHAPKTSYSAVLSLTADFMEMVNNPHLSDVQLQTDCGEVLNVHMFVLYARCPLLVEAVHTEGFLVDEASTGRVKRLLLNDVSVEAALCFLRFLYSAKTDFPSHCLPHVCELARRFGVKSLIDTCEHLVSEPEGSEDSAPLEEEEEDDGAERADNFQQLLKSMWVDEDKDLFAEQGEGGLEEEEPVDDGCVGDVDLEEIYEFAFTQKRQAEELGTECESSSGFKGGSQKETCVATSPSKSAGEKEEFMDTLNQQSVREHTKKLTTTEKSPSCPQPNNVESRTASPSSFPAQPGTKKSPFCNVSPVKSSKEPLSPALQNSQQTTAYFVSPIKSPVVLSSPSLSRSQPNSDLSISPVKPPTPSSPALLGTRLTPVHTTAPIMSPGLHSLSSPSCPRSQPPPGHSISPANSPPGGNFVISKSPACQLFPNKPSESSSDVLNEYSASVVDTISLISPERDDEPEPDLFSQNSPQTLDDSYDRMFSETCGEYVEPSGLSKTNSRIISPIPQHEQPILTSSPSVIQKTALPELGSSPNIQPTNRFLEPSPCSVKENRKTPPSSCSVTKSGTPIQNSSSRPPPPSTALTQDQDIILISSSDEEAEDNPGTAEAKGQSDRSGIFKSIKESPANVSCLNSSSELSWLIPATPMPNITTTGVSKLPDSGIPQSYETPKSCTDGGSQNSFISPTQVNLSSVMPSNAIKNSFFMKQPLLSISPEKLKEACHRAGNISCVPAVPTSSICSSNSFVKQPPFPKTPEKCTGSNVFRVPPLSPSSVGSSNVRARKPLSSNTPEKHTDACFITGSNVSCVPAPASSSVASSNVHVRNPMSSNSPQKHTDRYFSTSSNVSCVPPSSPSSVGSSNERVRKPLSSNTPEKHTDACFSAGSNVSCVPPSSPSSVASSNVCVKKTLFSNTPEKYKEPCTSTGSKMSCVPSSPPSSIASSNVFEVLDSDEEDPVAQSQAYTSACSFPIEYDEPPIPVEDYLFFCGEGTPKRPSLSPEHNTSLQSINKTPNKTSEDSLSSTTPQERDSQIESKEDSPRPSSSQISRLSCLNSKLWDDWEDEEPELPVVLPLSQRLNQVPDMQKLLKTPVSIVRKRELPPKVPITPLPEYSDMDTPVLKKELNKFGVRALPKKQMVLKLKEIYRYTHQVMSSDSEEDAPSLLPNHRKPSTAVQSPIKKSRPALTKTTSSSLPQRGKKKLTSVCSAQEMESGDDQPLTASQESTTSSVAASDMSSISHSSSTNEFETAFADEDDDDPVSASQAASKEELKVEAVRKFIEARPDLHKRILLYQPLDLAALHGELKQSGIKIAAGKLLDFLDSHCVTFTTATARKEKKSRGRRKAAKRQ
ncbi:structure-specific endonuclease subunit SLX4 [Gastrophryne carolinensis]